MQHHLSVLCAGILAMQSCASTGPEESGRTPLAGTPSESLLEVACRLTDGMVSDPRVARVIGAGEVDDRRAVVRLETFDDLTGWAVDMDGLCEGLLLHLLETGRFRFLSRDDSSREADFVIHGWLAPADGRDRSVLVIRVLSPNRQEEFWVRRIVLEAGEREGTFRAG